MVPHASDLHRLPQFPAYVHRASCSHRDVGYRPHVTEAQARNPPRGERACSAGQFGLHGSYGAIEGHLSTVRQVK